MHPYESFFVAVSSETIAAPVRIRIAREPREAASARLLHGAGREAAGYFTAPAVRPPTMYFCRKRNSATTGSAAITAPAENALQSA